MIDAKIILDSISPGGHRLTTIEATFPRFILSEANTHRALCLSGDSIIEFDLPSGSTRGYRRVYSMRIDEFVDKWHNGARRFAANPKKELQLNILQDDVMYDVPTLSNMLGIEKSNINAACKSGKIKATKNNRTWVVQGVEFKRWRNKTPEHTRFSILDRLSSMRIRQLDEKTGLITTSTVKGCTFSGRKDVFMVTAGDFSIKATKDHRIYTTEGYLRIEEIVPGKTEIITKKSGVINKRDPYRHQKVNGQWRAVWQRQILPGLLEKYGGCKECGEKNNIHVHHIVPVHKNPELTFEIDNVIPLCAPHHRKMHSKDNYDSTSYLYGEPIVVDSIEYVGEEDTYDLEIEGEFPNFLANGVVVHNSKNSASSRAIPVHKQLQRVKDRPFIPLEWRMEQSGMQGGEEVPTGRRDAAIQEWLSARDNAMHSAEYLRSLGIHKSITNRLLEPFMWHTAILTSDFAGWDNFFKQRCSPDKLYGTGGIGDAQPEFRILADMIYDIYNNGTPTQLETEEHPSRWHTPYILDDEDFNEDERLRISVARCARVSYLNHDGTRDVEKDFALYEKLATARPPHYSPFEHVAFCYPGPGPFDGWTTLRHSDTLGLL